MLLPTKKPLMTDVAACCSCMTNPATIFVVPCGHAISCWACFEQYSQAEDCFLRCPYCREGAVEYQATDDPRFCVQVEDLARVIEDPAYRPGESEQSESDEESGLEEEYEISSTEVEDILGGADLEQFLSEQKRSMRSTSKTKN